MRIPVGFSFFFLTSSCALVAVSIYFGSKLSVRRLFLLFLLLLFGQGFPWGDKSLHRQQRIKYKKKKTKKQEEENEDLRELLPALPFQPQKTRRRKKNRQTRYTTAMSRKSVDVPFHHKRRGKTKRNKIKIGPTSFSIIFSIFLFVIKLQLDPPEIFFMRETSKWRTWRRPDTIARVKRFKNINYYTPKNKNKIFDETYE